MRNIEALGQVRMRVYAIDLVNMGRSQRIAGLDAGLAATADRVAAWMDAVGLDKADIAGHSHGGAVAMMLAARHPERVRSLMLFAPANPYSDLGDGLVRLYSSTPGRQLARIAPYLPRLVHTIALGRMYGDPARVKPEYLEGYIAGLRVRGTVDHVLRIVRRWHADMGVLRAALPKIAEMPVLLVWGDKDRAVSLDSGRRLHGELRESEWIVVRGAGHVPFEELPELCNRTMVDWLERIELPRRPAQDREEQIAAKGFAARGARNSGLLQAG